MRMHFTVDLLGGTMHFSNKLSFVSNLQLGRLKKNLAVEYSTRRMHCPWKSAFLNCLN